MFELKHRSKKFNPKESTQGKRNTEDGRKKLTHLQLLLLSRIKSKKRQKK